MDIQSLYTSLTEEKDLVDHPMWLPVVVGRFVSDLFAEKIDSVYRRLTKIEDTTGMNPLDSRPKVDPLAMDMLETTRDLNSCSSTLSLLEMRISSLIQTCETTLQYNKYIYDVVPVGRKESLRSDQQRLEDSIDNLMNLCKGLLLRVVHNQKRATTQLAVVSISSLVGKKLLELTRLPIQVYNFMQQRDNQTNLRVAAASRSIAQASKHDSSAMKTIALPTMVFLPGTFVSVSLTIPVFDLRSTLI